MVLPPFFYASIIYPSGRRCQRRSPKRKPFRAACFQVYLDAIGQETWKQWGLWSTIPFGFQVFRGAVGLKTWKLWDLRSTIVLYFQVYRGIIGQKTWKLWGLRGDNRLRFSSLYYCRRVKDLNNERLMKSLGSCKCQCPAPISFRNSSGETAGTGLAAKSSVFLVTIRSARTL